MPGKNWILSFALCVICVSGIADEARAEMSRWPLSHSDQLVVSSAFYDEGYPGAWYPPAQHLGVDLPAPDGTDVRAPVNGRVLLNRTGRPDAFEKYLVIKDVDAGHQHVFGHVNSSLEEGEAVSIGDPIGKIVTAGTGPHLHWGINSKSVLEAIGSGWGWGRAPVVSERSDAEDRGWIDPELWIRQASKSAEEPWAFCNEDRSAKCLLRTSIDMIRKTSSSDELAQRLIEAAEVSLHIGNPDAAEAYAREATQMIFRDAEQDFHQLVNLGAVFGATGDEGQMRDLAAVQGQRGNSLFQIAGRLAGYGYVQLATELLPEIDRGAFRAGAKESIAMAIFEMSGIEDADRFVREHLVQDDDDLVNILAELSVRLFIAGETETAERYLSEARQVFESLEEKGSEAAPLARALMLSGKDRAAYKVIFNSDRWSENVRGHAAAGAAEAGNIDMALDLILSLKDSRSFWEYNRIIGFQKAAEFFAREGRLAELEAFLSEFEVDLQNSGWSIAIKQIASSGDIEAASRLLENIRHGRMRIYLQAWLSMKSAETDGYAPVLDWIEGMEERELRSRLLVHAALSMEGKL